MQHTLVGSIKSSIFAKSFQQGILKMKNFCLLLLMALLAGLTDVQAQKSFCVVIDPGHGGKDPGCVGTIINEKVINLSVALKVGALIEKNYNDVKIIYTRKTDVFIPLDERANIANRNKADLFISIHTNAARRGNSAFGTETYTLGLANSDENLNVAMRENSVILMEDDYMQKYEGFDPKSSESYIIFEFMQTKHMEQSVFLASEIQKSFVAVKRKNRGVRQAGLLVLRKTSMPAVLVELGFISNRPEERYMASDNGQNTLAKSIYNAFANFKSDYERKNGNLISAAPPKTEVITDEDLSDSPSSPVSESLRGDGGAANAKTDEIIYKVQILTSERKLPVTDKRFKGYSEISYYQDKGIYKYTYGATSDYNKIQKMLRKAAKDFKGAFIIKTKDGQRLPN